MDSKIGACPVKTELMQVSNLLSNITFHLLLIWLQTFTVIHSKSCQRLSEFPSFCTQQSEVPVQFNGKLSRLPFCRQVVYFDLLLCTKFYWNIQICSYALFSHRNQWMIKRLSKAKSVALDCNKFSWTPLPLLWKSISYWTKKLAGTAH